jgi:excisionase family DNA binding protein
VQEPVTMTVPEAARLLGVSDSAAYDAAARGEIPSLRIGRRVLVKRHQLLAMLELEEGRATGSLNNVG